MTKATLEKNSGKNSGGTANLTPFQPGQSGNPAGRPKGVLNFKTRLEMALSALAVEFAAQYNKKHPNKPINADDVDIMGDIFQQFVNKARNGDLKAIDSLLDRAYGKAVQPLKHQGDPENPLELSQESAKERAARMLAMYGHPVKKSEKPKKEKEATASVAVEKPAKVVKAAPKPKAEKKPKAAAAPVKKPVSRKPLMQRFAKKK